MLTLSAPPKLVLNFLERGAVGTITMPAQQVQAAAVAVISGILAVRRKRDSETIQGFVQKRWFSFKKGFYYKNEPEVIEWLDQLPDKYWRSAYGWDGLAHAKKLLKLAEHGDSVRLDQEDCDVLF